MGTEKKEPKNRRDRLAARVAATVLWPVARAKPESDWARMQRRLSALAEKGYAQKGEENPFIRAAEAASESDEARHENVEAPRASSSTRDSRVSDGAVEVRVEGEATDSVDAAHAAPVEGAAPSSASERDAPRADGNAGASSHDDAGEPSPDDESAAEDFAAWARAHDGGSHDVRAIAAARRVLLRKGVRPPIALFALLVGLAAVLWIYDRWRSPAPPQPATTGTRCGATPRG